MVLFPIVCDLKDRTNAFTIARVSVFTQASIVATSILLFVSYRLPTSRFWISSYTMSSDKEKKRSKTDKTEKSEGKLHSSLFSNPRTDVTKTAAADSKSSKHLGKQGKDPMPKSVNPSRTFLIPRRENTFTSLLKGLTSKKKLPPQSISLTQQTSTEVTNVDNNDVLNYTSNRTEKQPRDDEELENVDDTSSPSNSSASNSDDDNN